jgi:hypothetical protein
MSPPEARPPTVHSALSPAPSRNPLPVFPNDFVNCSNVRHGIRSPLRAPSNPPRGSQTGYAVSSSNPINFVTLWKSSKP